jgi:two-component system invasion response regulator UvrY
MELQKIHVAIADDHELMRKGMINFLEEYDDFIIDFDAPNGQILIDKISEAERKPDVCILDVSMPVMDGYHALAEIKKNWPDIKVIMVSMFYNGYAISKTLTDGASSYLSKDIAPDELKAAIKRVCEIGYYYGDQVTQYLSNTIRGESKPVKLSENEIEFLRYCCTDLNYQQIAEKMCLSIRTIDSYRDALFRKLNAKNRSALVMFAIQTGLKAIE